MFNTEYKKKIIINNKIKYHILQWFFSQHFYIYRHILLNQELLKTLILIFKINFI